MPIRFSIMTYNVHSCIGSDGLASPERIAEIIALYEADIICLQELDIGLLRSGKEHQAREIADKLNMDFHFHPSLQVEEGEYGNAILSSYPSTPIRAHALPTLPGRTIREQRGALWVRIKIGEQSLNVITTHLGLSWTERIAQAKALLGSEWLNHPACTRPVVFCGDMNTIPLFGVHRHFTAALTDACHCVGVGRGRSYPSRFPFLRLDHIFISHEITVEEVLVPRTKLTKIASDHLPVLARLRIE